MTMIPGFEALSPALHSYKPAVSARQKRPTEPFNYV